MRIAIPTTAGAFCEHFGRADGFFLCDVDGTSRGVDRPRQVVRPKTVCESIPQWLKDMGVTMVIAGGIGAVAQKHLSDLGIGIVPGQVGRDPATIAQDYLLGKAIDRTNRCQPKEHRQLHCKAKKGRTAGGSQLQRPLRIRPQ